MAADESRTAAPVLGAKLVVSPARAASGGSLLPGLVDGDLYDAEGEFQGTFGDLSMGEAKSLALKHYAIIEANGKQVWP